MAQKEGEMFADMVQAEQRKTSSNKKDRQKSMKQAATTEDADFFQMKRHNKDMTQVTQSVDFGNLNMKMMMNTVVDGAEQFTRTEEYEVQPGDTLTQVAYKFKASQRAIRQVNGLLEDVLMPGEILMIPIFEMEKEREFLIVK